MTTPPPPPTTSTPSLLSPHTAYTRAPTRSANHLQQYQQPPRPPPTPPHNHNIYRSHHQRLPRNTIYPPSPAPRVSQPSPPLHFNSQHNNQHPYTHSTLTDAPRPPLLTADKHHNHHHTPPTQLPHSPHGRYTSRENDTWRANCYTPDWCPPYDACTHTSIVDEPMRTRRTLYA